MTVLDNSDNAASVVPTSVSIHRFWFVSMTNCSVNIPVFLYFFAVNSNWFKSWKQRYSTLNKIREDAEDLITSKGKIKSIGNKIGKKLPKYQYMGILKIEKKTFNKLEKFYKKMNNKKISLTHFIDETIKAKIATYNYSVFKNYWYEIDNISDLNYLKINI